MGEGLRITYGEINDMLTALMQLGNLQITDPTLRYRVKRNIARLRKASRLRTECEDAIKSKYGKLNIMENKYYFKDGQGELAHEELKANNAKLIEEDLMELDSEQVDKLQGATATLQGVLDSIITEPKPKEEPKG